MGGKCQPPPNRAGVMWKDAAEDYCQCVLLLIFNFCFPPCPSSVLILTNGEISRLALGLSRFSCQRPLPAVKGDSPIFADHRLRNGARENWDSPLAVATGGGPAGCCRENDVVGDCNFWLQSL